ncbi:MAG TPA: hypothetical protein VFL13_01365 [Candidatus Baltobacteraceae bacterium]|nr:hypothetical protein [Candidatus Baltobacteraceae bacterium]
MKSDDFPEETSPNRSTYSPAEAAADLAYYKKLRVISSAGAGIAVLAAALLAFWLPARALALAVGAAAGLVNALLTMHGNERLLDRRSVAAFVISSFVRIGLFGIVPVVLAVYEPSFWTLGFYFAGFFAPLALAIGLTCKRR